MAEFKIGDRVGVLPEHGPVGGSDRGPENLFGTVCMIRNDNSVGICFDEHIGGHTCRGNCPHGHGWFIYPHHLFHETEISSISEKELLEVIFSGI